MSTSEPLASSADEPLEPPIDTASAGFPVVPSSYMLPFVVVTCLFALWGVANNMTDMLLAAFKKVMSMDDATTAVIQIAFYGAYFCLALPGAIFIRRYSYRSGIALGLLMYVTGAAMFYPASLVQEYNFFLAGLFVLAGGCSILETAANPYIMRMGPEETATQRLNLAQSFNPVGSILGIFLGKVVFLSQLDAAGAEERAAMSAEQLKAIQTGELNAVTTAYLIIAAIGVALLVVILASRFPGGADTPITSSLGASIKRLFTKRHWVLGVMAQFFYVGAQLGVWSFTIRYVQQNLGLNEDDAATYYLAGSILFLASRFVCTGLMKFIAPHTLLWVLSLVAACLCGVAIADDGIVGVYSLVAVSGCMSLMFPTIYGLALHGLGEDTKLGASGLIMAILGGAIAPYVEGLISVASGGIDYAFIVPLLCFLFVAYYGLHGYRADEPIAAES